MTTPQWHELSSEERQEAGLTAPPVHDAEDFPPAFMAASYRASVAQQHRDA